MTKLTIAGFEAPGFVKDIGAYVSVPEAWDEVQNFRFNSRGAISFGGYKAVLSPAPFSPVWLKMFPPLANPSWVYASNEKVGMFNTGHHDISRIGPLYTGAEGERWQGEVFSGVGIFNNTQDVPQAWLAFNETRLLDLPHWPSTLRCKFIRPFKQFLIAGNLTDNGIRKPYRLRWSHPADPGSVPISWVIDDPAIDAGEFDVAETSDELIDGMILGNQFIVYKQKSTHAMQFIGGNDIFGRQEIISNRGLLWRDCVQPIPQGHFVVGVDDIYGHDGQRGSERSLVENQLRNWIFNQISADTYFNCFTVNWAKQNEIWFCFPESGEKYPNLALVYNTSTQGIGVKDIPKIPFMYPGPVSRGLDTDPEWGPQVYSLIGRIKGESALLTGEIENTPVSGSTTFLGTLAFTTGISGSFIGFQRAIPAGDLLFGTDLAADTPVADCFYLFRNADINRFTVLVYSATQYSQNAFTSVTVADREAFQPQYNIGDDSFVGFSNDEDAFNPGFYLNRWDWDHSDYRNDAFDFDAAPQAVTVDFT